MHTVHGSTLYTEKYSSFQISDKEGSLVFVQAPPRELGAVVKVSAHTQCCGCTSLGVREDLENSDGACKAVSQEPRFKGAEVGWVSGEGKSLEWRGSSC